MPSEALLKTKLSTLPGKPGVYQFINRAGNIIYIGKAKSLKNRVRSYFTSRSDGRYQYDRLVAAIRDVEIILTRDEVEALKTEAALIRLHKPRYNVDLKDDKSFPYLKVTREPFPRVLLTRKKQKPAGDYYGPYTNVKGTRWLIRNLKGIVQVRDCNLNLTEEGIAAGKFKLCLDYHLGRCGGPCESKVDQKEYMKGVQRFIRFLRGNHDEIVSELETDMKRLSDNLKFEEAAQVRDRLVAARRFTERQVRVDPLPVNRDAIGLAREDNYAALTVITVRGGRIVGRSPFHMNRAAGLSEAELIEAFILRHYELVDFIPKEVFLPTDPPDAVSLAAYLSQKAGNNIHLSTPQRGEKRKLVQTAVANAEQLLFERRLMAEKRDFIPRAIKALQANLNLTDPPLLIEAFDISNLHGQDAVASMICFRDGKPWKSGYRIFRIKTVDGIDDFASIAEAVRRRYTRVLTEIARLEKEESTDDDSDEIETTKQPTARRDKPRLPDLILVDGGAGQLSSAKQALNELNLHGLPVIGLAKRLEEIYIPGETDALALPRTSSALRLLQQVRDEAHRFAVSRHRLLRGKRQVRSRLDSIVGIGPARRQSLLKRFGSIKRIALSDVETIANAPGMTIGLAELVKRELTETLRNR